MAETFLTEVKRYVAFGPGDEEALQALLEHARPHTRRIAEQFYDRLSQFPDARAVLKSDAQTERLKVTLTRWMERLLAGPWDEDYYALRSRIGRVHVQVRLPQRFMLTAMSVIRADFSKLALDAFADRPELRERALLALGKIMDIDLAIMLESYREDTLSAIRRYERMEKDLLERRLQISETRYHEIVDNAGVMMIAVDADDHIVLFNRKAEEVTDYKRAEVLGKSCLDVLCHPQGRDRAAEALQAAQRGDRSGDLETRMLTRTGSSRWVRWHVTPLASPGGSVACVIGVDVTDEREMSERTRRAERLAGLGTLAAGLAHEIRNPLNSAQLQLTLVERRLGKPETVPKALTATKVVRHELSRLGGLVEEFLDFARPRELRLAGGDLAETVRTVCELVGPEMAAAEVGLHCQTGDTVAANYDDERMKQVLLNLVRNAMQAASAGGGVTVTVRRKGELAIIEVTDTGSGPPDDVDIFAPFATSKEGGTGLGLPIVHRIVADHGGVVSWKRVNDSTVFRVELPLDGPAPKPAI